MVIIIIMFSTLWQYIVSIRQESAVDHQDHMPQQMIVPQQADEASADHMPQLATVPEAAQEDVEPGQVEPTIRRQMVVHR